MELAILSFLSLFMSFLPILLILTFVIAIIRYTQRQEKRAIERLETERQAALLQEAQFNVLMERLDRIEEKLEIHN